MEIEELAARQAIADTLHRYCRAIDRMDAALLATCYFDDAIDEHLPFFKGTAPDYIAWVMSSLANMASARHDLGNINIDLRGEEAGVESYWQARLRIRMPEGGLQDLLRGGRYIDRFEKRGGHWRIAYRISAPEFSNVLPVPADESMGIGGLGGDAALTVHTSRDRSDVSYRFLTTLG